MRPHKSLETFPHVGEAEQKVDGPLELSDTPCEDQMPARRRAPEQQSVPDDAAMSSMYRFRLVRE